MNRMLFYALLVLCAFASCRDSKDEPAAEPSAEPQTVALDVDGTKPVSPQNRIIYEMDLLSFTSAGTLVAASDKLEELHTLGIDIVWLMPIHPRGDAKFATYPSPYAPKDYYAVWSKYGNLEDLKSFVSKAHALGMEVWLDWVPNHTGTGAVWVTQHPEYYVWLNDEIKHPNDYSDVLQLAMKETATQNAMIDAMKYWITEAGIDGFRCDYVSSPEIPADFWKRAIPELKNAVQGKNITVMGEADFADQTRLYGCGFDFDYAWRFNTALRKQGNATSAASLKNTLNALYTNSRYKDGLDRMVYLTNHDDNESGKNYWQWMTNNVYLFTVLEFTAYGMPLIYNGQEVGHKSIIYPWEKNTISWNAPNVKMRNTIRALCALKHTQPALANGSEAQRGTFKILACDNNSVLAYQRQKGDNTVLVILNLGEQASVKLPDVEAGKYEQWINSETIATAITKTTRTIDAETEIVLPAKGYAVFVK